MERRGDQQVGTPNIVVGVFVEQTKLDLLNDPLHTNHRMLPAITIVTPSYNQGEFIEATIQSVIGQNYPNLTYIVMDACSTDGTHEILQKYSNSIDILIIEPDEGSADAINKGLRMAREGWFNWLNSDDILLPGALFRLVKHAERWPQKQWISGVRVNLNEQGDFVSCGAPWCDDSRFLFLGDALFPQEATFIRTDFLKDNGLELHAELNNVYDTVLYLELLRLEAPLLVSTVFSAMRWHGTQKTANSHQRLIETPRIHEYARKLKEAPYIRFARRLCSTRLSPLMRVIFLWLAQIGAWPSRLDWDIEIFNPLERKYESKRLKDHYSLR
jgi:glycosyltransferase involved in cell wall biosynthesis